MKNLTGVCVPICTPFDDSGEQVDETALKNHIDSMIDAGVHIILVCGGTGEFAYLRAAEKKRIAEVAAQHIDGRVAFMAQTSAISTSETIEFTKHLAGIDGHMAVRKYFGFRDADAHQRNAVTVCTELKIVANVHRRHQKTDLLRQLFAHAFQAPE